jgi:hypothetical protein
MNTLYELNRVPIHLMQLVIIMGKHLFQKEKYLRIEMFEMNFIMVKKTQRKQQVEQPFIGHSEKHYLMFEFFYLHLYYLQCIF